MSFGKRSFNPADRLPGVKIKQSPIKHDGGLNAGAIVTGVAGLVIFTCGSFIAGHAMGFSFGLGNSAPVASAYFQNEPLPKARDYDRNRSLHAMWDPTTAMTLHMETTKTGFDAIDSELHERCMKRANGPMAVNAEITGKAKLSTIEAAEFLTCSMTVFRSRFCERHYRKRLANRIKKFLYFRDHEIETQTRRMKMVGGRQAMAGFDQFGGQKNNVKSSILPKRGLTREMQQQIRELSGLGLLYASDFGTLLYPYPPEEVAPHIVEQKKQVCA